MARARLDLHVVVEILQMRDERFFKRHLGRRMVRRGRLFFVILAQKFSQPRFRHREMVSAQALPNFFIVAEGARIIAPGFVTDQILNLRFSHVMDREKFKKNLFPGFIFL